MTGDDEVLLGELADLLGRVAGPSPGVVEAAKELYTWRTVDAEIAALTYDSLLDETPAAVRAAGLPRILTFEADGVMVEVELVTEPSGRRLLGQVVPAQPVDLELHAGPAGPVRAEADELGRFVLPLPERPQRLRLRLRLPDGAIVDCASLVL